MFIPFSNLKFVGGTLNSFLDKATRQGPRPLAQGDASARLGCSVHEHADVLNVTYNILNIQPISCSEFVGFVRWVCAISGRRGSVDA